MLNRFTLYSCLAAVALLAVPSFGNEDTEVTISPKVEEAIDKGLAFLARSQKSDGSWDGQHGKNVGDTSLAIMALVRRLGRYGR